MHAIRRSAHSVMFRTECAVPDIRYNRQRARWGKLIIDCYTTLGECEVYIHIVGRKDLSTVVYPAGLESAIEAWMRNWGYAGMKLQEYIFRMFGSPAKYRTNNPPTGTPSAQPSDNQS